MDSRCFLFGYKSVTLNFKSKREFTGKGVAPYESLRKRPKTNNRPKKNNTSNQFSKLSV